MAVVESLEFFAQRNRWPAPAKLNLCLYVVGKRADGYHDLETLFQLLDVGDELSFELNSDGSIDRDYDFGFDAEVDLCLRAAHLLHKFSQANNGVTISLQKRLPMGGGLGGGSSDAATVLIALNYLWRCGLSVDELANLGLKLGADVPVFVRGYSAWGSGVGERLQPYNLPMTNWIVAVPRVCVSTAQIFSHNRLTPSPHMKKIRALKTALEQDCFDYAEAENQFEPIVRDEFAEVASVFEWFESLDSSYLAGPARLSGSGGTVFAALPDHSLGEALLAKLNSELANTADAFIAKSVNVHPLSGLA